MLARGIKFRFVHDLAELLTVLERNSVLLTEDVKEAAILTDYSVESRYPGPFEPITEEEFVESLKIAEAVVAWAEQQL
jgi:HEPN domain-containing protein